MESGDNDVPQRRAPAQALVVHAHHKARAADQLYLEMSIGMIERGWPGNAPTPTDDFASKSPERNLSSYRRHVIIAQ
jgi:hypothetical protein